MDAAVQGALLMDKPAGPTSHDVVAAVRRILKTSRIGHTGTLDPLATGLLVLLVGPATRLARFLASDEKEYIADVRLGVSTPTYDAASLPALRSPLSAPSSPLGARRSPTDAEIEAVLDRFRGSFLQTPPPYSAKKVGGVAAYEKARRNEAVDLQPVSVTVRALQVLPVAASGERTAGSGQRPAASEQVGLLRLRVVASAGFYVRSLAHDLGQALGCGAHLEALRRTRAGPFRIEEAVTLDALHAAGPAAADRLIPIPALLAHLPAVTPTAEGLRLAAHGNPLRPDHLEKGDSPLFSQKKGTVPFLCMCDAAGEVIAVAERRPDGLLHPLVVLR
jgi:tRNA pseudouridine55 synthase